MKISRLLFALIATAGCSSDPDESPASSLKGKWMLDAGGYCIGGLTFDGGTYEADLICSLESGSWGIEAEGGSYGASDTTIDFVPELASCFLPDRDYNPYSMKYSVSEDVLRLTTSTGLVTFDKISDDPNDLGPQGGAVAKYGCVEEDGFYAGEIMPVN